MKGSTGSAKDHQHESLHALGEVRHLPTGSSGDGGNKDDICRRIYKFKTGKKRIKKQWKYREKKEELHTFKDTTQQRLDNILETNKSLGTAYYLYEDIDQIWMQKKKEEALGQLEYWCRQAQ